MKKIVLLCLVLMLAACAHLNQATPDQRYDAYRAEVNAEREAGTITAVVEQERLRDRYWQIYGKDPESAGHFAFSISLMRSAQAGDFPMKEAQALVAAQEKQILTLRMASHQVPSSYEYP